MTRTQRINNELRSLLNESPDITASALISDDGLIIASALPQGVEEVRIGGMSATIHSLGARAARELQLGNLKQVLISGEEGYAVMLRATEGSMLLVLTNEHAKLGMIFLDMSRSVKAVQEIL